MTLNGHLPASHDSLGVRQPRPRDTMKLLCTPNLQPTLVGEMVLIRPLRSEDWHEMFAAASDPLIWELHPARDRYTEPVFRDYFDSAMASKSAFAFVEHATGLIIGSTRF